MTPTTANLTALLVLLALVFIALIPLARWGPRPRPHRRCPVNRPDSNLTPIELAIFGLAASLWIFTLTILAVSL